MLDFLDAFLPVVIYILLVVLIILLIIIAIKVINTMNKVKEITENVDDKIQSLNNFFYSVDSISSKMYLFGDKFIDIIISLFKKIFKGKDKNKEEDEDE